MKLLVLVRRSRKGRYYDARVYQEGRFGQNLFHGNPCPKKRLVESAVAATFWKMYRQAIDFKVEYVTTRYSREA